jgi:ribonucleoside-triphosphate reductase
MSQREQSARSKVVERRTYQRPLDADGTVFETTEQAVDRILNHQQWLWERAKGEPLNQQEKHELSKLGRLHKDRSASVSGRTRWLGGTRVAQTREASQFNCSFEKIATIHDVVDAFWLLLQGCGVGGKAEAGILNGFAKPVEIKTLKACITREEWDAGIRGEEENLDYTYIDHSGSRVWKLSIGDSAEAWSKSVGKLLAMKDPVDQILLDFGDIRPAGIRLSGYGWISSGDVTFRPAMVAIAEILNRRAGQLLTKEDINDIINWLGTTLSSRRSAEILLCDSDEPDAQQFALRKKSYWEGNPQREQSNNSLVFWQRPSRLELRGIFDLIEEGGGSEPGFINGEQARMRAPWFQGVNP